MDKLKDKKGKKMEHLNIQIEWNTFSTTSETDRVWYIHKHVPEMTDKCMYTLACACLYSSVPIKLCLIWKLAHSFGATNVLQPASQPHYTPIWHCTVNYIIIVETMTTAANCDLYTITTTQLSLDGWIHTWSHSVYKCTSDKGSKQSVTGDGNNDFDEEASKRQKNKNNLFQLTTLSFNMYIVV